jgi:PAS domain S-box-containing protein
MIWNDRMYEMYGLDPATFVPTNVTWLERVLSEDRAELQERIPRALREPGPHHVGFRTRLPSGEVRHLSGSFVVVRDSDGQPFRMIGVVRDRTEQVQAEAEHRRLQEERQHSEKLESLGSLAGGMAHDMNNVLAGILGTAELLRQSCADASPTARSLDSILHAAGRGRDLVRALTDFARKGLAQTQEIDLNDLLRKEVELLRHATPQKVQVLLDLDPLLPKVLGDPSALGGTFMNLGVNALDAMPDGGTLSFRTRAQGAGRIEVRVVDTGVGMAPEVLVRAMEPFFTTKPAGKGTGLGLARVYGTVKAHGGTVQILSAPGQGTAIVIQLPGYREPQAPAPEPAERAEPRGPLRVLLVDDDPILLESIPPLLESRGHRVTAVPRGEEALTLLEQGLEVDLVVLDHNMPGLTGAETLVKIRECRPGLPVILATGFVDGSTEAVVAGLPGVRVLNKPYRMEELCQALAAEAAAS